MAETSSPSPWLTVRMLLAVGVPYLIMMGSTFFSLGVVLPHMLVELHLSFGQAGVGFTLLATAAGLSSLLPAAVIRRSSARVSLSLGAITLMLAYVLMALCHGVALYDAAAVLLGLGFSLIGAVPALQILAAWSGRRRSLVFGCYLAFGGIGGALWPGVVEAVIGAGGSWRGYWWFMTILMGLVGLASVLVVRERPPPATEGSIQAPADADPAAHAHGASVATREWTLAEALRTPQFYVIGCGIAGTYLVASTINAFTVSYLKLIGAGTALALTTFSVQSACHAIFPILMGGLAERVGARALLVTGLVIQVIGMFALASASATPVALMAFAIGVGGGYGTVFLATTLTLQRYYGTTHYAAIFGANQLFTTVSVVGPTLVGAVADATGRFDASFAGCGALLGLIALVTLSLRLPTKRDGAALAGPDGLTA